MSWNFKNPIHTPLKRVRNLGAAHDGVHHWWAERVTSLALVPLTIWFLIELLRMATQEDAQAFTVWLAHPLRSVAMVALLGTMFYHSKLGIQVVIEDYVHCKCAKTGLLLLSGALHWLAALATIAAVAKIHFAGMAPVV